MKQINHSNRQAFYNYFIEDKYVAGIVLLGTEVKSVREGKVSFRDSFCFLNKGEIWLRGLYIAEYKLGTSNNHIAVHDRKLLLKKREINRIQEALKGSNLTIIPLHVFVNDKKLVKVEIGLAKGKKLHDKRESIKKRDNEKEMKRFLK